MALFKQTCPTCVYEANSSARFCPQCGTALGGTKPCVYCLAQIPAAAEFCLHCGRPQTAATRQPGVRGSVWHSGSDEFAVRIERDDLKGRLFKDLEIQPGQQAVFLIDGRAEAERQGPGRYQVDSFFERVLTLGQGRHVTALVVRGAPISLESQLPKLYTSDDFELGGRVVLAVQVANPPAFFANVMRSQQTLTLAELRNFLFDQVRAAVQEVVGQSSFEQFKQQSLDFKFRDRLTTAVLQHLEQKLQDSGLKLSQMVVSEFTHPRYDALRRQWEDIALFRDEVEAARTKKVGEQMRHQANLVRDSSDLTTATADADRLMMEYAIDAMQQQQQGVLQVAKMKADMEAELTRQRVALELEMQKQRLDVYKPMIQEGMWGPLAQQLAQNPGDIGRVTDVITEMDSQKVVADVAMLHAMIQGDMIEDRHTRDVIRTLVKNLQQSMGDQPMRQIDVTVQTERLLLDRVIMNRYIDIACPRRVWVETPRVSVVVRLTVTPPQFSAITPSQFSAEAQSLALNAALPVRVRVTAPGFTFLNAIEQETTLAPTHDSPPLVFDLQPTQTGHTRITFDFFQAGNPVGTASVPMEVVAQPVDEAAEPRSSQALRVETAVIPPDTMLFIASEREAGEHRLTFTLFRRGEVGRTFHPVTLTGDPAAHAAALYEQLTGMAANRRLPVDDVDRKLRAFGRNLWRDLIPDDLKAVYAAERLTWRDGSLLIVSDEPYFPWELIWPYDAAGTWQDDEPWCTALRLTRWLRRDAQGNGHEAPPGRLALHSLACLAPTTSNLPKAQEERAHLERLAAKRRLTDISPSLPTRSAVLDLLERENYGWLHAATHGEADSGVLDAGTAIRLQDREWLAPEDLVGPEIEGYLHRARPAFFFNVCHGSQQGWALTRLGGWANRLISAGAGLFIAPLWSVTDAKALTFAQTFYDRLLDGATVGEAARAGRLAARAAGDPTWLAYSVYAHPNARLDIKD